MPNFMLLATAWGPKFGGINAFNMDFALGLASYLGGNGKVFCAVFQSTADDVERAKPVILIDIGKPVGSPAYDPSWAWNVWQKFREAHPNEQIDWWVGHDVTTGWAAVEGPAVAGHGQSALIMHMNYIDYQPYKGGVGEWAQQKHLQQRELFVTAAQCFANGPLLRDALRDIVRRDVTMLVPGFAKVPPQPALHRLQLITFGRLDREGARIKQGALAVAGFASAIKQAWLTPGSPQKLKSNPQMRVIGIKEPGGEEERALKQLAYDRADREVNLISLRFDENRDTLFAELGRANIALMLSWHEGFGLTGWEAVAGEVPLILSRQTGLWQLLEETFGEGQAGGYVRVIDVRGQEGEDDITNFRPEDEADVCRVIIDCAAKLDAMRTDATNLKRELQDRLDCRWENTARQFCNGLGIELEPRMPAVPNAHLVPTPRPSVPIPTAALTPRPSSRSEFIAIPRLERLVPGSFVPDSVLLRPESQVVRFHKFREPLCDTIIGWAWMPDAPIKLRLQAGEGGAGKTRLLIEVCKRLEEQGWRAGFLDRSRPISNGLPILLKEGKPCLIVFDYAETRTSEIIELIRVALRTRDAPILRLVLLAREGGDWWDRLADAANKEQTVAGILRGITTKTGPYRMAKERIEVSERGIVFRQALADFATVKKSPLPEAIQPDLSDELFGDPLFIHLAALSHLRGLSEISDQELLSNAVGHERTYWRHLLNDDAKADQELAAIEQAIALLTLCSPKRSAREAKDLLARTPRLRDLDALRRVEMFDLLRRLYPLEGGLRGLQPDLLGETLVAEALAKDDELLDVALGDRNNREDARYALTVLTRLARRVPSEQKWLERALKRHLKEIPEVTLSVGREAGSPLVEVLVKVLRETAGSQRNQLIDILQANLPDETVNLVPLGIEVKIQATSLLRERKGGNIIRYHIRLYETLSTLAKMQDRAGLLAEAAESAVEAMRHASIAFQPDKEQDQRKLGVAFRRLSGQLGKIDRFEDALEAAKRAESIHRKLAEKPIDAYMAEWATSLQRLSGSLYSLEYHEDALEAARKSESIYQILARKRPNAYMADWADSLEGLAIELRSMGRFEEGLEVAERGERIYRTLAKNEPGVHTVAWARSLGISAIQLLDNGRFKDAVDAAKHAEVICMNLAEKQPDMYTMDWSISLENLAIQLSYTGRFEEALDAAMKVERLRHSLVEKQPDAYNAPWASSLDNLALRFRDVGRFEEALEAAEKAESLKRRLAEKQPGAYTVSWAASLCNLAEAQVSVGRYTDAIAAAALAVTRIVSFADRYPLLYKPWLAFSYRVSAEAHLSLNRYEEALADAKRSTEIWAEIARQRQHFESVQVAKAFRSLMKAEMTLGQSRAAIAAFESALKFLQKPLSNNPALLRSVLSEMIDIARTVDEAAATRAIPVDVLTAIEDKP